MYYVPLFELLPEFRFDVISTSSGFLFIPISNFYSNVNFPTFHFEIFNANSLPEFFPKILDFKKAADPITKLNPIFVAWLFSQSFLVIGFEFWIFRIFQFSFLSVK